MKPVLTEIVSVTRSVQSSEDSADSPAAGGTAIVPLAVLWLQNKCLFCIPHLHASTEAKSWGRVNEGSSVNL